MARGTKAGSSVDKVAIVVVHGVGEQARFEHLQSIAAQLKQALDHRGADHHVQLRSAEGTSRLLPGHSAGDSPVSIRWRTAAGRWLDVEFREVHWADLDMPPSWGKWLKLVGWSLGASGVRLFQQSRAGTPEERGMCAPRPMGWVKRLWVRTQLFLASLLFLFLLATVGVLEQLLKRLSISMRIFTRTRDLLHDYLGDVKLYQDWSLRHDDCLEVIGEKSRVAIRRRMIRALVQAAADVERGTIQGYYVLAHSLGSVVAFNGLMERDIALPNYLTEEEWVQLPDGLKSADRCALPSCMAPKRPPWLDGGAGETAAAETRSRDLIDRRRLLAGMRGLLTMGSPLDKFAALWSEIVLINQDDAGGDVPWINIADVQDIVGGKINLIAPCEKSETIGGLRLVYNERWSDQWLFTSAHTSYWRAKQRSVRLINQIIDWLEGKPFVPPKPRRAAWVSWAIFLGTVLLLYVLLPLSLATLWLLLTTGFNVLFDVAGPQAGDAWSAVKEAVATQRHVIPGLTLSLLGIGAVAVLVCAAVRWIWETVKFGPLFKRS